MARTPGLTKRAPRIELRRQATLINADGMGSPVTILDVSSGGFRLEVAEAPRIGEHVRLRVDKHDDFPAEIRWASGSEAGGVFLTPIDWEQWS